ncbi:tail fiber protein [Proteus phage PM16]|uniref:Tail fiber protein n=1 Tax=Proteus phage PM16 TaxID=1357704 RepID=A0A0A6ZK79_9CAUD|nr:tail fiber protein [Proteus phage PM16]AGZ17282.1 tail fiber protein [Proteus phage PM16]
MAFSYQEEIASSGQQYIQVSIAYFDQRDIHLLVNSEWVNDFVWESDTRIRLETPLQAGSTVRVIRRTDESRLRVLFSEGAAFTRDNLDEVNTQLLYLTQEAVEGNRLTDFYFDINMHGNKITNLGNPTDAKDAVTKEYSDAGDKHLQDQVDVLDERVEFLANNPIPDGTIRPFRYTADTDEVVAVSTGLVFSTGTVWLNGVKLDAGHDYSVTSTGLIQLKGYSMYKGDTLSAYLGGILGSPENVYATVQELETVQKELHREISTVGSNCADGEQHLQESIDALRVDVQGNTESAQNALSTAQNAVADTSAVRVLVDVNTQNIQELHTDLTTLDGRVTVLEEAKNV